MEKLWYVLFCQKHCYVANINKQSPFEMVQSTNEVIKSSIYLAPLLIVTP